MKTDKFFVCKIIGLVLIALGHILMFIFHSFVLFTLVISAGLTLMVVAFCEDGFKNNKKDEDYKDE